MNKISAFGLGDATAVEHLEGGVTRKILKYGGKLMLVEVTMPRAARAARTSIRTSKSAILPGVRLNLRWERKNGW